MEKVEPGMWVMKDRDSEYEYDKYLLELPEVVEVHCVVSGGHFTAVGYDAYVLGPEYWKPAKQHYIKQFKQIYESTTKTDATGRIDT